MSRLDFQLGFQLSPIIFVDGIATQFPGNMEPIIAITQAADFNEGLLSGEDGVDPDDYFAHFRPVTGGTLTNNQIGQYPFANQQVAANAIISQPLQVSLEMRCPPRGDGGFANQLVVLTALKQAIDQHTAAGGTYIVATPSFIYTGCILLGLRDITGGDSKTSGIHWQWDFTKPLLAEADPQFTLNSLMSVIDVQLPPGVPAGTTPTWSGASTSVGSTLSGAISRIIPSASSLVGTLSGGSVAGKYASAVVSRVTGG